MSECADIMMVTYNRLELTKKTLESLLETTDYNFNLIIVDNASSDKTVEYLKEFCIKNKGKNYFKDYNIIENKQNFGIAVGRNKALAASKEEWLVTFDNDVIVPKGWLTECINILKENKQYGACGANFEGKQYPIVKLNNREFQDKPQGNLGTACMVFNRQIHKLLGFFNYLDYSKKYGIEDSDFGARLWSMGIRRAYILQPGIHLGEGEYDTGDYRKMKTFEHDSHVKKFQENCRLYFNRQKPIYIPFKDIY